ncbi:MAG: Tol-Pal system beta propeller repeat protein TolB [Desulfobacterales bacterium]|nr:Tol-Pal system beta propeller repeat protein TolB [Desulfobacterales bacterium]MCP4158980.1 Tol-Pal system beta propeller repeat protein TolB [Deltaproteobacteria bacterium]
MLKKINLFVMLIFFLILHSVYATDYEYIEIKNPYLNKIPIGIPSSAVISGGSLIEDSSVSDLLSETLAFTNYFKIDKLPGEKINGVLIKDLNFKKLREKGYELFITCGFSINKSKVLRIEFRLFDVVREKRLLGKIYKSYYTEKRNIVRRFATNVVKYLTGKDGFFNSKIAFVSKVTGHKEVYTCDFDGKNIKQITNHKSITLTPAMSIDGRWIAYTSYIKGKPDLYIRNLKNNTGFTVSKKGVNITPAWLPNQKKLAASLSYTNDQGIYLINTNGRIVKRLTKKWSKWGIDLSPTFSPDGKRMAFVSNRSGMPQIFIKNFEDKSVRRLTYFGRYNTSPKWSPTGDKIIYSSMAKGKIDIFMTELNGEEPVMLTTTGDNESPSWSPDGTHIVFSSRREGVDKIYIMTLFGTDQRRLLEMEGKQTSPFWSGNIK